MGALKTYGMDDEMYTKVQEEYCRLLELSVENVGASVEVKEEKGLKLKLKKDLFDCSVTPAIAKNYRRSDQDGKDYADKNRGRRFNRYRGNRRRDNDRGERELKMKK
eukprot:TRINITY_DN6386_c0_g2_i3.p1 TRINITY_DN6386_c0_g2~~TRINITY_DN6386_c0_g2_i3.p1  ORF type:complete len:107 (+),score=22.76 TRINITY_DN6386_c0_g2_i3:176-496(+)